MNDEMRLRSAINLDELERQLREAATNRGASRGAPTVDDPLAELARLVGHTEPARDQPPGYSYSGFGTAAAPPRAAEPQPAPQTAPYGYAYPQDHAPAASGTTGYAAPASEGARGRDDANAYPGTEPYSVADPYFVDEGALDPVDGGEFVPQAKPRRTGVYILAAMAVVAAGGVGVAAWMKRDDAPTVRGPAPVIAADPTPTKVPPPNPGGMQVPNQNTQIYNRTAPDDTKTAKVVPSEEQPVDVAAAQRLAGNQPPAAPSPNNPGAALGMGEAKKVRSVTVRPDGTIVEDGAPPPRLPAIAATPVPATPAARPAPALPSQAAAPPAPAAPPVRPPVAAPAPAPAPVVSAPAPVVAATPAPAPVRAPAPPVAPPPSGDAGGGDFAVQLGAPGSEAEAREAVSRLQQRFGGVIGGRPLSVRPADVNGRTIFRVRVTGLSREDANGLCERLKAAGGQCFVARN